MPRAKSICKVDGCERFIEGHGYCSKHYQRFKRNGTPELSTRIGRPREPHCKYHAAHYRIRRDRGSVYEHTCIQCGEEARQWALRWDDPSVEIVIEYEGGKRGEDLEYSLNPQDYDPMCQSCHRFKDNRHATV